MPALELIEVSRRFGGVEALRSADLRVEPGQVHALVGANGAGKSTLAKIIAGTVAPDHGQVLISEKPVTLRNAVDASRAGIAVVSQELTVFPDLDVLTNLFMPTPPIRHGLLSRPRMQRAAQPVLERLQVDLDLQAPASSLSLAESQLIEICRALIRRPKILVLDEPNSALDSDATRRLLAAVRASRADGVAVVYVSHFLEEVFEISDVITVVRDGRTVVHGRTISSTSIDDVVESMLGEHGGAVRSGSPSVRREPGGLALRCHQVQAGAELLEASFSAHRGEIVALIGLDGSGAQSTLRCLFGAQRATAGFGQLFDGGGLPSSPAEAVRRRIALVPADRKGAGLMLYASVAFNVGLVASTVARSAKALVRRRQLALRATAAVRQLDIKVPSVWDPVGGLSGGNQQKVVLAKWLAARPSLLLLDDPTRGVDIHSKAEIHHILRGAASDDVSIVFTSTDLAEVCEVADRVIVFYRGRSVGEIDHGHLDETSLVRAINTGRGFRRIHDEETSPMEESA